MGALALIPLLPEMVKPEYMTASEVLNRRGEAYRYMRVCIESTGPDNINTYIEGSMDGINWDNTGTMTIPTKEGRYKVRYTVHPDSTETEIVEE
jgi:hypothetical protein